MAKKKKAALKPNPARGFATTSVPSKKPVAEASAPKPAGGSARPAADGADAEGPPDVLDAAESLAAGNKDAAKAGEAFDPRKEEEQALQNLVDRVWERAMKESSRAWKQIEFDRRLSTTLPSFSMDDDVRDEILHLALNSGAGPSKLPVLEDKAEEGQAAEASAQGSDGGAVKPAPQGATEMEPPTDATTSSTSADAAPAPAPAPRAEDTPPIASERFIALLPSLSPTASSTSLLVRSISVHYLLLKLGFSSFHAQLALSYSPSLDIDECVAWLYARMEADQVNLAMKRGDGRAEPLDDLRTYPEEDDESAPPATELFSFTREKVDRSAGRFVGSANATANNSGTSTPLPEPAEEEPAPAGKKDGATAKPEDPDAAANALQALKDQTTQGQAVAAEILQALSSDKALDTLESPSVAWGKCRAFTIRCDRYLGGLKKGLASVGSGASGLQKGEARAAEAALAKVKLEIKERMEDATRQRGYDKAAGERSFKEEMGEWEKRERVREEVARKRRDEIRRAAAGLGGEEDEEGKDAAPANGEAKPADAVDADEKAGSDDEESKADSEVEDMFGGMLDETPDEVQDVQTGASIVVRPMPASALKGAGGGKTPRALLNESLRRIDPAATTRYEAVGGGGRIFRARLTLRWNARTSGKGKGTVVDCFTLTGMALASKTAAEDALAVVALGCVEREKPVHRNLGPGWREWWDEVEALRAEQRDERRRSVVASVGDTVHERLVEEVSKQEERERIKRIAAAKGGQWDGAAKEAGQEQAGEVKEPTIAEPTVSEEKSAAIKREWEEKTSAAGYQKMLPGRQGLPIAQFRDHILDIMDNHQIFVLSGETGCGKSTQVPAYIVEHCQSQGKPCKVYVTEPRRISAISLAERVSQEMGEARGAAGKGESAVGYAIRLESRVGRNAKLVYATTGIVLRMLEGSKLDGITHIILDEVHERSIESDFLLIVLKTLMEQRPDLKVILMSATLDAERISDYFGGCPTVSVPGRTFPVEVRYLEDAVELCDYTIEDNSPYARRIKRDWSGRKANAPGNKAKLASTEDEDAPPDPDDDDGQDRPQSSNFNKGEKRYSPKTIGTLDRMDEYVINHELIVALLERICFDDADLKRYSAATLVFMPGLADIRKLADLLSAHRLFGSRSFRLYPLHSTIASEDQGAVFNVPPKGVRKIVIATNIAETGITIPDITCVIDTGKHREMRFDEKRQLSRLVECFVAKSNAKQRRGRAGRVQEGLCFHLFTKVRHDDYFAEHPLPEMLRLSLQDLALKLKVMKVQIGANIEDALSKAMDPPAAVNVQRAIASLVEVKALTSNEEITPLGRHLSRLPLDVHMGKFLLVACLMRALDPALTIAATLNAKSPFVTPFGREAEADRAKASFNAGDSDFITCARAFAAWRRAVANGHAQQFCSKSFLSPTNLQQIEDLRQQYMGFLLDSGFVNVTSEQRHEIINSRYGHGGGKRGPRIMSLPEELDANANSLAVINAALVSGLYPKLLSVDPRSFQLRTLTNNAPASIHPSSVNFKLRLASLPRGTSHMMYFSIMSTKKLYAWETGAVEDRVILAMCGDAEYKVTSNSLYIDRQRMRFAVLDPKVLLALRVIREQLVRLINASFRSPGKPWSEDQARFFELATRAMGMGANERDRCFGGPAPANGSGGNGNGANGTGLVQG